MSHTSPVLVVHGGSGAYILISHHGISKTTIESGVKDAAKAGYTKLTSGGTAVDAVEAAVMSLENNPIFNAGCGSCLTVEGNIEMDASIMDGSSLKTGAVACVQNVKHPVQLSRIVMEKSAHVLLAGDGAKMFAQTHGVPIIPVEELSTAKSRKRLQDFQTFTPPVTTEFNEKNQNGASYQQNGDHDTVGAVALDCHGNVAYVTSTGGINAKLPGRVGDSPLVGSGGYSDNRSGAVTTTGHGESFIKTCLSKHASIMMEQGNSVQETLDTLLDMMLQRVGGMGGAIAVNIKGDIGVSFNTKGMSWCWIKGDRMKYGVLPGECLSDKI